MLGRERRFRAGFSVPRCRSAVASRRRLSLGRGTGPPFGRPQPVARAAAATATPSATAASPTRLATPAGPPPAGHVHGRPGTERDAGPPPVRRTVVGPARDVAVVPGREDREVARA